MAMRQLLITSLVLCYLIQYVACFCNVTCTTDYCTSLNCSCSGTVPSSPILLEAECRDFEGQVNDSCEITPSQSWCIMQPEDFGLYISADTKCSARVKHTGKEDKMKTNDSTDWKLYKLVKLQHPVNVQVTEDIDSYNVTWQMNENIYLDKNFMYMVRIKTKNNNYLKDPDYYTVREDRRYLVLNSLTLQPGTEYVANVQASVNPVSKYQGPWSEWSSTVEWRTTGEEVKLWGKWSILLTIVPCLILCCLFKILWPKRLDLMNFSPSPEDFFKPLYHTYGGDFKKWVGPVFILSELDPLEKKTPIQMMTEKQLDVLELSRLSVEEDCNSSSGDQGTCHSAGHISIDTVMVSGEEGALPGSSWETYKCSQGGGSFFQYTGGSRGGMDSEVEGPLGSGAEEEGGLSGQSGRRASTGMPAMEWQLQLQAENYQPEQISLDSEDSYPPMVLDLDSVDTIDSGVFVESDCSSPVNSNFDSEEQIDSALLSVVGSSPSEYVKQWVTGNTVQEDTTNSGQNRTM